jgi:hypothetical protein
MKFLLGILLLLAMPFILLVAMPVIIPVLQIIVVFGSIGFVGALLKRSLLSE